MRELIDRSLGSRYQIAQFLGEGGMGSVYRATDSTLQRDVAIKVLHPWLAQNPETQQRFRQEARIAAHLSHPNIVGVHDFGQDGDIFYIAMELILGDNLRQMMNKMRRQRQWIILSEAIRLIREMAFALDYAHKQGVLHRDIKPANIMIKDETVADLAYQPVITDLGLAKLGGSGLQTRAGSTLGTPAYMSPEQTLGKEVDARSDIYSLGVLLYELVAAHLPFPAKNLAEAKRYHTQEVPPPLQQFRPDLPLTVEQIILKAMTKEPDRRFSTAGELARVLAALPVDTYLQTVPPVAIAGASSFKTYYQYSRIELDGESLGNHPVDGINEVDRIEILAPNHDKQYVEIRSQRLTLGRHSRNEIVLADQAISRHHAHIEFDGERYLITDLGSANGTYLARNRLHPNSPTPWKADEPVRLGNYYLILRCHTSKRSANVAYSKPATPLRVPPVADQEKESIRVALVQSSNTVEPGSSIRAEIIVVNRNDRSAQLHVEVEGLPLTWISTSSIPLTLPAQGRESVVIYIRPTYAAYTRPGRYTLEVAVYGNTSAEAVATTTATFNVQSFVLFESKLEALVTQKQRDYAVTIQNQGNTPQKFNIVCRGESHTILFHPERFSVQIPPGQSERVTVQTRARRQWVGKGRHPIQVQIRASDGTTQIHEDQVIAQFILLHPAILVLLLLLLGIVGAIWLWGSDAIWQLLPSGTSPIVRMVGTALTTMHRGSFPASWIH